MRRLLFVSIIGVVLIFTFIFFLQNRTYLLIQNTDSNSTYAVYLPKDSKFCIKFTHSVALSPVEEWFYTEKERIVLESTVYEDFGAGLPHDVSHGQKMLVKDGKIHITGYNVSLLSLQARVGRVANHELLIKKGKDAPIMQIPLQHFAPAGKTVKFSVQEVPYSIAMRESWEDITFHTSD